MGYDYEIPGNSILLFAVFIVCGQCGKASFLQCQTVFTACTMCIALAFTKHFSISMFVGFVPQDPVSRILIVRLKASISVLHCLSSCFFATSALKQTPFGHSLNRANLYL